MEQVHKRFRVLKAGQVLEIHGTLGDTANLNILNEMVADQNIFDCSGILATSWLGLTTFNRYLNDLKGKTELVRVPARVFRCLKLMPQFGTKYTVTSFEIEIMDPSNPAVRPQTRVMGVKDLEKVARKNQGGFLRFSPSEELVGSLFHLLPSLFKFARDAPETYTLPWAKANHEHFSFWYNYLSFVGTMNSLSVDLIVAVQNGLSHLLRNIKNRIANAEAGVSWIHPELNLGTANIVTQFIEWMDHSCSDLCRALETVQANFETLTREVQVLANRADIETPDPFFDKITNATAEIIGLRTLTERIETIGERTGRNILGLKIAGTIKAVLAKVEIKDVPTETLAKVRDSFEIMDPMSEDSWLDTREVIDQELEEINADTGQCVVIIQGFDLLRQVLEHRMFEAGMIAESLPALRSGTMNWTDLKAKLEKQIARAMVTDQEKFSNSFFIKHVEIAKGTPAPGDVFLF